VKKFFSTAILCLFTGISYSQHYAYKFQVEKVNDAMDAKYLIEPLELLFNDKESNTKFRLLFNDERHEFSILSDKEVTRLDLERLLQAEAYTLGQFDIEEND
jgi:hypothetical protein